MFARSKFPHKVGHYTDGYQEIGEFRTFFSKEFKWLNKIYLDFTKQSFTKFLSVKFYYD